MNEEEHEQDAQLEPMTIVESAVLVTEAAPPVAIPDSAITEDSPVDAESPTPTLNNNSEETPAEGSEIRDESE